MAVDCYAVPASIASGDLTETDYEVAVAYYVRDGSGTKHSSTAVVVIPRGTPAVKANRLLRDGVADHIYSTWSLTIDPSDIYFPHG